MKFHPTAQIVSWCLLTVSLQVLSPDVLIISASCILFCSLVISRGKFIQLCRRTRWIMLSLLLIYAYSTPGLPLLKSLGIFSPVREGLNEGFMQLLRIISALAGLAILLERLDRQKMISGLYTLLTPLRWLGVSRERIAVRLALTLHYAEVAMMRKTIDWQSALQRLHDNHEVDLLPIDLKLYRFGMGDMLLVSMTILLLLGALR